MRLSLRQFSVKQKAVFVFGSGLAILLFIGVTSYNTMSVMISAAEWRENAYKTVTALERLLSSMKDIEAGQRGYVITGNTDYLPPYRLAVKAVDSQLLALETMTADNP